MLQDRTISTQASLNELYYSEVTKAQTILKHVIIPVNIKKRKPFTHHDYTITEFQSLREWERKGKIF
jgi:hypothetical protein